MAREPSRIPRWAVACFALLTVALGLVVGVWLHSQLEESDEVRDVAYAATSKSHRQNRAPKTARSTGPETTETDGKTIAPASAGLNHPHPEAHPHHRAPENRPDTGAADASWATLESGINGNIGVAIAPLGSPQSMLEHGPLQIGHAWSSMKVPIVTTLMRNGEFTAADEELARSAITASDNEAAAALFSQLESTHGGLTGASAAVQETLAAAGDTSTQIATAPAPPGAVSTWGQTEWSLEGSVEFYGALACGGLVGPTETESVLTLMEEVIAEQQWGLGQAGFPSGTRVAFKAGWGPEVESNGAYLVRQAGIIRVGSSGLAVTMIAEDASGSFEASVSDIDQIADWVAQNLGNFASGRC